MLVKLPNIISSTTQVEVLIADLRLGKLDSEMCSAFLEANPRFSRESQAMTMLIDYLQAIVESPVELKITFAQSPDAEFMVYLTDWARTNLGNNILLKVDTNPMLTGGMIVRSTQKIYDFSWSKKLNDQRNLLEELVSHAN